MVNQLFLIAYTKMSSKKQNVQKVNQRFLNSTMANSSLQKARTYSAPQQLIIYTNHSTKTAKNQRKSMPRRNYTRQNTTAPQHSEMHQLYSEAEKK